MNTPDQITGAFKRILTDKHNEHLAALERQFGLQPKTIQPLRDVDSLPSDEVRPRQLKLPAVLVGISLSGPPQRNKYFKPDFLWGVTAYLVVDGQNADDTLKRRDWYSMTVAECLLSRLPRDGDPFDSLALTDMDFQDGKLDSGRGRTIADCQLTFQLRARDSLNLMVLPTADTPIPAGTPGGPPATPYAEPEPWPKADPVGPIAVDINQED